MLPSEAIRNGLQYGLTVAVWFIVVLLVATFATTLLLVTLL